MVVVEFQGEDLYEATKDFYLGVWGFEILPLADPNKALIKKGASVRNSRSWLSGLESALQWKTFKKWKA